MRFIIITLIAISLGGCLDVHQTTSDSDGGIWVTNTITGNVEHCSSTPAVICTKAINSKKNEVKLSAKDQALIDKYSKDPDKEDKELKVGEETKLPDGWSVKRTK